MNLYRTSKIIREIFERQHGDSDYGARRCNRPKQWQNTRQIQHRTSVSVLSTRFHVPIRRCVIIIFANLPIFSRHQSLTSRRRGEAFAKRWSFQRAIPVVASPTQTFLGVRPLRTSAWEAIPVEENNRF